jgi:hypothetical protein
VIAETGMCTFVVTVKYLYRAAGLTQSASREMGKHRRVNISIVGLALLDKQGLVILTNGRGQSAERGEVE